MMLAIAAAQKPGDINQYRTPALLPRGAFCCAPAPVVDMDQKVAAIDGTDRHPTDTYTLHCILCEACRQHQK